MEGNMVEDAVDTPTLKHSYFITKLRFPLGGTDLTSHM